MSLYLQNVQISIFFGGGEGGLLQPGSLSLACASVYLNLLTPNVNYSGRTAPLTSKVVFYIFI